MELEIELTEIATEPSLITQPNGRLRLTFHWNDEIRRVLERVTHPLRDEAHDGFLHLWGAEETSRSFEHLDANTVLIRLRATS